MPTLERLGERQQPPGGDRRLSDPSRKQSSAEPPQSRAAGSGRMAMPSNHRRPQVMERGSTLQRHPPIDPTPCRPTVGTHQQRQKSVEGGWVRLRVSAAWMPRPSPRGEGALLAKHCFASARTHSRQRLGRPGDLRRPRNRAHPAIPRIACCCRPAARTTAGAGRSPAAYPTGCSGTFASTRAQGNNGPGSRLRATLSVGSSLAGTCSRSSWSCPAIRCSDG